RFRGGSRRGILTRGGVYAARGGLPRRASALPPRPREQSCYGFSSASCQRRMTPPDDISSPLLESGVLARTLTADPLWYKDAIIYQLHVKAFFDADNDGIGDFEGLRHKLDYLQDLGVTTLWLLPFYPSPLRDDGYDISDYKNINPSYGRMHDFKLFVREAH